MAKQRTKTTKPEFIVPYLDLFRRRRLKMKDCLGHCPLMLTLDRLAAVAKKRNPYVIAQGCVTSNSAHYRHCWLETRSVVIDLIRPERFFQRAIYYDRMRIDSDAVFRYTLKQMFKKMHQTPGQWAFWDAPPGETDKRFEAWSLV